MADLKGPDYLRRKLAGKRTHVLERYGYYDMKNRVPDLGISTPPGLVRLRSVLGWCGKSVDALADRLQLYGLENDGFDMETIFKLNNADIYFDAAILAALIGSCSFTYISEDDDGYPRLQVIDGSNATGIIDANTGLLSEGYAVLNRDEGGNVLSEAYFTPDYTAIISGRETYEIDNDAAYPLLVPHCYRPDATRPFGHSRITRASMAHVQGAARTIKRSEISAEFYSFPQKYITGLSQDAEDIEKWKASMSAMLSFTKDDEGDKPSVGQFQQQSMSPYADQLRMFASLFAGESGLTVDDLGFPSDNPASAEAIKASHENLRLTARKAQRCFGSSFLNVGLLAASVRDGFPYQREAMYQTSVRWSPIFEPDAAMLSSIGDGVIKLNQAVPGFIGKDAMRALTGIEGDNDG